MNLSRSTTTVALAASVAVAAAPFALPAQATAKPTVYHHADSGRTVHVAKGDTFKVNLKQLTDSGYEWVVTRHPDGSIVKYVGHKTHNSPQQGTDRPLPGAPTRAVFTFRAVGSGTTSFKLAEKQFGRGKAIKRFTMTVKVS